MIPPGEAGPQFGRVRPAGRFESFDFACRVMRRDAAVDLAEVDRTHEAIGRLLKPIVLRRSLAGTGHCCVVTIDAAIEHVHRSPVDAKPRAAVDPSRQSMKWPGSVFGDLE